VFEVPVVFERHALALRVLAMHPIGRFELGDRLEDASGATQAVPVHVSRVRDVGRGFRERRRVLQRLIEAAGVLVGVRQVVMRRGIAGRSSENPLVVLRRREGAALPALRGIGRLGEAAQQHQLHIIGVSRDRGVERAPVRRQFRRVAWRVFGRHLQRPRFDMSPDVIGR
jgi:hypothetical protein